MEEPKELEFDRNVAHVVSRTLRLSDELNRRVQMKADMHMRSFNSMVCMLLMHSLGMLVKDDTPVPEEYKEVA